METIGLETILLMVGGGALAGFLSGLLGIGGGSVLVPILFSVLSLTSVEETIRMHIAVGTAFLIILPTAIQSFRTHLKKNAVDLNQLKAWAPTLIIGVILGWGIAAVLSSNGLELIFAFGAFLIAGQMALKRTLMKSLHFTPSLITNAATGGFIGVLSSLMGIGGGVFATAYLSLIGRPIKTAIATASGVGVIIAFPGVVGYIGLGLLQSFPLPPYSLGYVSLLGALIMGPLSVLCAPLGAHAAHALPEKLLNTLFMGYLIVIAIKFLFTALH